MIKMVKDNSTAWASPKQVEGLKANGWSEAHLPTPTPKDSQEITATLKATKRSKK